MRHLFNLFNYGSRSVRGRFFGGIESRFLGKTRLVNPKLKERSDFKRIGVVTSLGFLMVYTVTDTREKKEILKNAKRVSLVEAKRIIELDGLNLNERNEMGWTCLHVQVANHNISAVKFLLALGADPNISYEFRNTGNGNIGRKPPHEMLCQDSNFCKFLVNVINFKGFTSLHLAVLSDNLEMVTILLEAGADPLKKSEQGFTPSCLTNNPEILKLLQKYQKIYEGDFKEDNVNKRHIIEKVNETGNELEHEINIFDQNEDQMPEQSSEVHPLKNETMGIQSEQMEEKKIDFPSQDSQTSSELNMISVLGQSTTELDEVQKQKINGEEVTEDKKLDCCERIPTLNSREQQISNEPNEGEKTKTMSIQSELIEERENNFLDVEETSELSYEQKMESKEAKDDEICNLKVLDDIQTSKELVLLQEQRTTELDEVQKQNINVEEVTPEPEGQKQKIDCERANTSKMQAVNDPSERENVEPLSDEITEIEEDVQMQEVNQEQLKAIESQVHDFTFEQGLLVKTELTNEGTLSEKSEQVENLGEEDNVELVNIVEEQKSKSNELDGVETLSIQSEQIQKNGSVITDVERTTELSPEQKMETIELEVKEKEILKELAFENGFQNLEHTLNIVEQAQLFDELKVNSVHEQRASELGKVELKINGEDVTPSNEQKQKLDGCDLAETPKMETANEPSEEERMEPLSEGTAEIKGDLQRQEIKQEQRANVAQVLDFTCEQVSIKNDGVAKIELTTEETSCDKPDTSKSEHIEKRDEEVIIKLVEIEEQNPKANELNVIEEVFMLNKLKINEEQQSGREINQEMESKGNIDASCETETSAVLILKADKLETEPSKQELNTGCHEEAIQMEAVLQVESEENLTPETPSYTTMILSLLIWASVVTIKNMSR